MHTAEVSPGSPTPGGEAVIRNIDSVTTSAGAVLVCSTVKDLIAGSGIVFEEPGEHELKGVP